MNYPVAGRRLNTSAACCSQAAVSWTSPEWSFFSILAKHFHIRYANYSLTISYCCYNINFYQFAKLQNHKTMIFSSEQIANKKSEISKLQFFPCISTFTTMEKYAFVFPTENCRFMQLLEFRAKLVTNQTLFLFNDFLCVEQSDMH